MAPLVVNGWAFSPGGHVIIIALCGGDPSVQGVINLIPRRVVWDSLGFTPLLGSPPDFIWNSVDPYCGC